MNWITIIMGLDDLKAKINRFDLKKIVLGTIRGVEFLYISHWNLITSPVFMTTMFFYSFSNPPHSGVSFSLILSFSFHLYPPRVDQVTGFDPCPIGTFLKFLGVVVRLKITIQVSFHINVARELVIKYLIRW